MNIKPKYDTSMDELYTAANLLKSSLEEEIAVFGSHKLKYNAGFVTSFGAQIAAADAIPDASQREAANEGIRIMLMLRLRAEPGALEPAEGVLNLGKLRTYIEGSYSNKDMRKARLKEAGFDDYDKAMRFNWEKVQQVLQKGKEFIDKYLADLTGAGSMPAAFEATFDTMADSIIAEVNAYLITRENVKQLTQQKIVANNALFDVIMEICKDGQTIFSRNPAKKVQFIWDRILEIVTPPGAAGLRGTVKENGTNYVIAGAQIEMQTEEGTPVVFMTDADGKYYSGNLPAGLYSFKLSKAGYDTIETEVEIKVGTTSYKHFKMSAGGGTVYEAEGNLVMGAIGNIDIEGLGNPDADVVLEALGAQMNFFASNSADGGNTGGVIPVGVGMPVSMKASVLVSTIGLNAASSFFNVQNAGVMNGGWKVRVSVG